MPPPDVKLTAEQEQRKELVEKVKASIGQVTSAYDRVQRDLGSVALVEARLKSKQYDTSSMVTFLKQENDKVSTENEKLVALWIEGKEFLLQITDDTTDATLTDVISKNEARIKHVVDLYKAFSKNTLSEFVKMKG